MHVVFRVQFEGELQEVTMVEEGHYVITMRETGVIDLLDDDEEKPTIRPRVVNTFEQALASIRGWEQGRPSVVAPCIGDVITAALVSHNGRMSSGWQRWLKTGQI